MKDGTLLGAVSVFNDITELSRSQEELEKAQRLNQSIFKAAADRAFHAEFSHIIGQNPNFLRCLRLAELVAPTDATVLIEGESGAGKSFRQRHTSNQRKKKAALCQFKLFGHSRIFNGK